MTSAPHIRLFKAITVADVTGNYVSSVTRDIEINMITLCDKVNKLLSYYVQETGNPVERSQYGALSGPNAGLRPLASRVGAVNSSHKEGKALDMPDRTRKLSQWLLSSNHKHLEELGLYMENPADTPTWVHLTTRRPPSGSRVFNP